MTSIRNRISAEATEALREEMRQLRRRLDTQTIITDKLLRTAVEDSTRYSRRAFRWQWLALLPLGIASLAVMNIHMGFPIWFCILTVAILVGFTVVDYRVDRLSVMDYSTTPLVEIQHRLILQKKLRARRMACGIGIAMAWICLFAWVALGVVPADAETAYDIGEFRQGLLIGAVSGGVGGGLFGFFSYRRMQRDNTQAINRLRDFTEAAEP